MKTGFLYGIIVILIGIVVFLLFWGESFSFLSFSHNSETATNTETTPPSENGSTTVPSGISNGVEETGDDGFTLYEKSGLSFRYPEAVNGKALSPKTQSDGSVVITTLYDSSNVKVGAILVTPHTLGEGGVAGAFRVKKVDGTTVRLYYDKTRKAWIETSNIIQDSNEEILSWSEALNYFTRAGNAPELKKLSLLPDLSHNIYPYYEPTEPGLFGYRVFFQSEQKYIDISFVTAAQGGLNGLPNDSVSTAIFIIDTAARSFSF
jgi:hypothetical protein